MGEIIMEYALVFIFPLFIIITVAIDQIIDQYQINKWEREHEEDDE